MIFSAVKPQIQPTVRTCSHTCLSMLTGIPVEYFMLIRGNVGMTTPGFLGFLQACEVRHEVLQMTEFVGWYSGSFKSLNKPDGYHRLLFHVSRSGRIRVIDPSCGKRHRKDGSTLGDWGDLVWVIPKKCEWRTKKIRLFDPPQRVLTMEDF